MAFRSGLVRKFFCTSIFSSQSIQSPASAITSATAAASAPNNPPTVPSTTLFVSGLNKRTTTEGLQEAFSKFGQVVHARVVTDRVSGYSKGFGFVRYATLEEAEKGMKGMDATFLDGWVIFAEYSRPRATPGVSGSPSR